MTISRHIHQTHQSLKRITCYLAKSLSRLANCPEKSTNSLIHSKSTLRNHDCNHIIGTTQSWVAKTVNSHLWKKVRRVSLRRKIKKRSYQQFHHNQEIENISEPRFTFLTKTDRKICLQIWNAQPWLMILISSFLTPKSNGCRRTRVIWLCKKAAFQHNSSPKRFLVEVVVFTICLLTQQYSSS